MDFKKYNKLYKDIAIGFDMVVPYYKICKDGCPVVRYNDIGKEKYREMARKLLDNDLIFSEQWYQLKRNFFNKFYAIFDK